ncbi:hypothetical protein ACFQ7N_12835 [Streptomyces niveus]|uniref:hypothetical protein n=1 Tax=Streptomyces niveus TaxID=193462 RepID=UPI003677AD61
MTTVPDYAWAEGVDRFFNDRLGEYGSGVKLGYNAMDIRAFGFFLDPALEEYLPEDHELSRFANTLVRTYSRTLRASEPDERGLSDSDRSVLGCSVREPDEFRPERWDEEARPAPDHAWLLLNAAVKTFQKFLSQSADEEWAVPAK